MTLAPAEGCEAFQVLYRYRNLKSKPYFQDCPARLVYQVKFLQMYKLFHLLPNLIGGQGLPGLNWISGVGTPGEKFTRGKFTDK